MMEVAMTALVATQGEGGALVVSSFRALKHIFGLGAMAVTLDYFLFNGSCTEFCGQVLSQGYGQLLFDLQSFRTFF
jgi:hypothetical protein